MHLMPTELLKYNIDGVYVPQFQIAYICVTPHPSHKNLDKLCCEVHYMWWENQYLELKEWEDFIKSNKKIILAIIMLVPKINPQGYKEHIILFIVFTFGGGVTIIDWKANMKIYVPNTEE